MKGSSDHHDQELKLTKVLDVIIKFNFGGLVVYLLFGFS
uniref:Uncharacterized protein n=1 Tax=Rhizophora mucronata TaxID=61149 RepID=A0A2P2IZ45_RHIMU